MMVSLLCSLGATIAEGVASDRDLVHRVCGFLGRGASLPEAAEPILRRVRNRTDHPNERCQRLFRRVGSTDSRRRDLQSRAVRAPQYAQWAVTASFVLVYNITGRRVVGIVGLS